MNCKMFTTDLVIKYERIQMKRIRKEIKQKRKQPLASLLFLSIREYD